MKKLEQSLDPTDVSAVFSAKARIWTEKGTLVRVVNGNDSPLDVIADRFIRPSSHIIDVGGGNGKALARFARRAGCATVTLVDRSREMALAASQRLRTGANDRSLAVVGDAGRMPLPDAAGDVVLLRQLLQHVADPAAVVREAARVTRPGGVVLIQVPGPEYLSTWSRFAGVHAADAIGRFAPHELVTLIEEAGLSATVEAHRFRFEFGSVENALLFLLSIGLLEKLVDYEPTATAVLERLLAQPLFKEVVKNKDAAPIQIGGQYLTGIGRMG